MNRNLSKLLLTAACALALSAPALAAGYKVVHVFKGGADGGRPLSALTPDGLGNFYGTVSIGGGAPCSCGAIFRLAPDGKATVVYAFTGGSDGASPSAGVMFGKDGKLYGTTASGGVGYGTVYRVTIDGVEEILHTFHGGADGATPQSAVIMNASGTVFGTTTYGGSSDGAGYGTVYKVSPTGHATRLYKFGSTKRDGVNPLGALAMDKSGNLYGTTVGGGDKGAGTVFKITSKDAETILYSFHGNDDGGQPSSELMIGKDGYLSGTTKMGGTQNFGTIFMLTPAGTETVLHSFTGGFGGFPMSGVIADDEGNLYGTSTLGFGSAYQLAPDGHLTILQEFGGGQFGENPVAELVSDGFGNLYGMVVKGGYLKGDECRTQGCGMVFRVTPKRAALSAER